MAVLDRNTFRLIERYLYSYRELVEGLEIIKSDIIEGGNRELTEWGGGTPYVSDPTAIRGVRLCKTNIIEQEHWIRVIEQTMYKYAGTEKGRLMQLKYERELSEREICSELHIERATYYNWRQDIVMYAALVAAQEGLIRVA